MTATLEPVTGDDLYALVAELYPICRSITGDGVRRTLEILGGVVDLEVHEVPTGTKVLDWTVPQEWNVTGARVVGPDGGTVADLADSSLHLVSYSTPVHQTMSLDELRPHLHALADQPDAVPYRTSYYQPAWGFCVTQRTLDGLRPGRYFVQIDSTLADGHLTYAEHVVPGDTADEVLVSAHTCHPSLADDNLSGLAVSVHLARWIASLPQRRYTYRFVYTPGTIGAITWLEQHRAEAAQVRFGLTLTCLGDDHPFTYKRTEHGATTTDRVMALALRDLGLAHQIIDFFPYGYDERQYNSPGFRMPVGSLMRGRHGQFPEYHTSGDNLSFVSPARLAESLGVLQQAVQVLEGDATYVNLAPEGEPQLGARGLYGSLGGLTIPDVQLAMLWVLNQSDGTRSLLSIAERSGLSFDAIRASATALLDHGLLAPAP
jgi:aminopeptidase-like protein